MLKTDLVSEKYLKYKNKYLELKNFDSIDDFDNFFQESGFETDNLMKLAQLPESIINFNFNNTNAILTGGGYFYEQNDLIKRINVFGNKKFKKELYQFSSIYLKCNLTNPDIIKRYSKIRKTILKNNSPPPHSFHITLLIFEINLNYPIIGDSISYMDKTVGRRKVRKSLSFLDPYEVKSNFEEVFKNMLLTTVDYEVLGKLVKIKLDSNKELNVGVKNPELNDCVKYPGSYFVDKFEINNKNLITTFRTKFYEKLNEFMKFEFIKIGGKVKDYVGYRADNESDPDYILIFYDNFSIDIPFLAIKKFYYGKNTWTPHISVFNMEELGSNNMKFLEKYCIDFLSNHDKNLSDQMVFDELKKNNSVKDILKKNSKIKITVNDVDFELQV
jgi:hypothetical protein